MRSLALFKFVQHPHWEWAMAARFAFDDAFVRWLNDEFPAEARRFNPDTRNWLFRPDVAHVVLDKARAHFAEVFRDGMIVRDMEEAAPPVWADLPLRTLERGHFDLLGVRPWASLEECRAAFRLVREARDHGKVSARQYEAVLDAFERVSFHAAELDQEDMGGEPREDDKPETSPWFEADGGEARARQALEQMIRRLDVSGE